MSRPDGSRPHGPQRNGHRPTRVQHEHRLYLGYEQFLHNLPLVAHHQPSHTPHLLVAVAFLIAGYEAVREASRRYELSCQEYANRLPSK